MLTGYDGCLLNRFGHFSGAMWTGTRNWGGDHLRLVPIDSRVPRKDLRSRSSESGMGTLWSFLGGLYLVGQVASRERGGHPVALLIGQTND